MVPDKGVALRPATLDLLKEFGHQASQCIGPIHIRRRRLDRNLRVDSFPASFVSTQASPQSFSKQKGSIFMASDNVPHDDQAEKPSATLIPVQVEQIDQLVLIARDLAGFVLILDAAAIGDPTLAAVERIVSEDQRPTSGVQELVP